MRSILASGLLCLALLCGTCCIATASTVTGSFTYQGTLTDPSGNPLTGSYPVRFNLYDVVGDPPYLSQRFLASDNVTVQCTDGKFTSPVTFDFSFFDGRSLLLGITVGSDPEMTPRQQIRPVPYALGLRPGPVSFTTRSSGMDVNHLIPAVNISLPFDYNAGIDVSQTDPNLQGVTGVRINVSGLNSNGIHVDSNGLQSTGIEVDSNDRGISIVNWGGNGSLAVDTREGTDNYGIFSYGLGDRFTSIRSATYGDDCIGIRSDVYGERSRAIDIFGLFDSTGVYVETDGTGIDIKGSQTGVNVTTGSTYNGVGIRVTADADANNVKGVLINTHGSNADGISIVTDGSGDRGAYIYNGWGGSGGLSVFSVSGNAITAGTAKSDGKWAFYTDNGVHASWFNTPSGDVAEYMPAIEDFPAGTVLIIGEDSRLARSETAYDTRVAGIVSTKPGLTLGGDEENNADNALIAVAGRVPCNVDASNGPIHPGDLLTTSNTPGYAMKAADPKIGTILGKAMGTLESGTGTIEVIVTLQ
ncbi:MAG: hypothetical protein NT074_00455 [Methanomicrobiales archaeon]|nr:hypothetical protein [Methanomicrobiales archaeon]